MPFGQGSRSSLSYVVESSFGATPTTPTMLTLPYNTHSLDLTKQRLQSEEIISDRLPRIDRHGNRQVEGDIVVEMRDTDYDDLIESAFFNTFTTAGVLKIGTTPQYLTIEDGAEDIGQYRTFTGCAVSTMNVSVATNQMVTTTFSVVGQDMAQSASPLDASPTAPSGGEPFDSYSGAILEGGSTIAVVTSFDFNISNSLAPTFVLGSAFTPQLEYGRANVEGTVTAYYEDAVLLNKFLNETESSMQITLDDPTTGNSYTFLFPRIKYNGGSVPVQNPQSRLITMPFVALYDVTENTNISITKA